MKKFLLSSLILILIPCIIFGPVYCYMIYMAQTNAKDYTEDVLGEWEAIQYYYESQRVACKDETWIHMTFEPENISVEGTVLPPLDSSFTWESGSSLVYETEEGAVRYLISFDSQNNLKIIIDETSYIILLRRCEGGT